MKNKRGLEKSPLPEPTGDVAWKKAVLGGLLLCAFACFVSAKVNLISRVVPQADDFPAYYQGALYPPGAVAGHDFWVTFTYAGVLLKGANVKALPDTIPPKMRQYFVGPRSVSNYPPFIFMLYAPYHLFSYETACHIQMLLLLFSNLFVIGLALILFTRASGEKFLEGANSNAMMAFSVLVSMSFLVVSSYGFSFSIERGNCDIFSMVFAWLFLYVLLKMPEKIWVQAFLLACAVHIKITPAIFVALFFWRHRWKCIVPLIVANLTLLLCWGPENAWIFINALVKFGATPDGWWGDHSAYSFAATVLRPLGYSLETSEKTLVAVSLLMWGSILVVLWRRGLTPMNQLLLFISSVPVMHIVPNCSNDYKLVIIYAPIAVLLLAWFQGYVHQGKKWVLVLGLVQLLVLYFTSISGMVAGSALFVNKFLVIFVTQLLLLTAVIYPVGVLKSRA